MSNFKYFPSAFHFSQIVIVASIITGIIPLFDIEGDIAKELTELQGGLAHLSGEISKKPAFQFPLERLGGKALAAMLGGAVGDALGRVTEFKEDKLAIQYLFSSLDSITLQNYVKKGRLYSNKVLYTDDTVMSMIVLEVALQGRDCKWSNSDIVGTMATRFIPWVARTGFAEGKGIKHSDSEYYGIRAHGPTNQDAMERNYANWTTSEPGEQWWDNLHDSGRIPREGGCGSVMRAWPLGIVFHSTKKDKKGNKDIERAVELAMAQSRITHRLPMAQAACGSLVAGVAYAINNIDPMDIVDAMIKTAKDCRIKAVDYYKKRLFVSDEDIDEKIGKQQKAYVGEFDKKSRDNIRKYVLPKNDLLLEDMLKYAKEAALGGDAPDVVLGTKNDKGSSDNGFRSKSGALLGWAADEALAAALYIFIRYTHPKQLELRKEEFKAQGRQWDKQDVIWYAIQEGVATVGDSDSIASLTGVLMGAYYNLHIPETEKYFLMNYLESFDKFVDYATWFEKPRTCNVKPQL